MTPRAIGSGLMGLFGIKVDLARKLAVPGFILAVLLALGACWGMFKAWDWWDDRQAVQEDRTKANAEFAEDVLEAERTARAEKDARDEKERKANDALEDAIDEADRAGRSAADDVWNCGLFGEADEECGAGQNSDSAMPAKHRGTGKSPAK